VWFCGAFSYSDEPEASRPSLNRELEMLVGDHGMKKPC